MAVADPYAAAKGVLRDNLKILMAAFAGVAGLLLAGAPFSGFGALAPGTLRFWLALAGLAAAVLGAATAMRALLDALQPDLVDADMLRDDYAVAQIDDPQTREQVQVVRAAFDRQRRALLPSGLEPCSVEALKRHIDTLWQDGQRRSNALAREDYQRYRDHLEGLTHWATFIRLRWQVRQATHRCVLPAALALAGLLLFVWAAHAPAPGAPAGAGPGELWVVHNAAPPAAPTAPSPETSATRFGPVRFDTDSDRLDDPARAVLASALARLRQQPDTAALIQAYTDTRGSGRHNAGLAGRRAAAVAAALTGPGGVARQRVFSTALGPTDLPMLTADQVDAAVNRSVWLWIVPLPPP